MEQKCWCHFLLGGGTALTHSRQKPNWFYRERLDFVILDMLITILWLAATFKKCIPCAPN